VVSISGKARTNGQIGGHFPEEVSLSNIASGEQDRLAGALLLSDLGSRLDELSLINYIGHGEYVTFHFGT